jgi:hypothetical protein
VGTYIGLERRLGDAQTILDEHPVLAADGRCMACGTENCPPRSSALSLLASARQLPSRRPGATRPELIGARRVA